MRIPEVAQVVVTALLVTGLGPFLAAQDSTTPVADAAQRGDRAAVESLLQTGADVNAARGDGMTALHFAAENGHGAILNALVGAGAKLDVTTRMGSYTPLHLACRAGNADAVLSLLRAGSDAKAITTTNDVTPLHFAAAAGSAKMVQALVDAGADVDAVESSSGQTPLMFAAARNRVAAVRALLDRGADLKKRTRVVSMSALRAEDRTIRGRRNAALREFRNGERSRISPTPHQVQSAMSKAREAPPARTDTPEAPPDADVEGQTPGPLSFTDLVGHRGGLTALLHATREGHARVVSTLLAAGADINEVSGGDRTSPMLLALLNGHFDLALTLLDKGADPKLASAAGCTPLYAALNTHWAPKSRYPQQQAYRQQKATYLEVMDRLLAAGADPNARLKKHLWFMSYTFDVLRVNTTGATPFWRAAYATDVAAMRLLVDRGADPKTATLKLASRRRGSRGGRSRTRGATGGRRGQGQSRTGGGRSRGGQAQGGQAQGGQAQSGRTQGGQGRTQGGQGGQGRSRRRRTTGRGRSTSRQPRVDPSGLPPVPAGGPAVHPIHAASGVGYGQGYAGNAHRHVPGGWLPSVRYLVEEHGADVNCRDQNGYTPLHHAAARGDDELIQYLISKGADPKAVSRRGQTTADMANGPVQRLQVFPETVELLQRLGSKLSPKRRPRQRRE